MSNISRIDLLLTKALVWEEKLTSDELTMLGATLLALDLEELAIFSKFWRWWIAPSRRSYYRNPEVTQVPLRLVDTCVWWQWKRRTQNDANTTTKLCDVWRVQSKW